jgi:hypothetical protein
MAPRAAPWVLPAISPPAAGVVGVTIVAGLLAPCDNCQMIDYSARTPARGEPGSIGTFELKGGGKQYRIYGPDGRATKDYDVGGHDHGAGKTHVHEWDWNRESPRGAGRPPTEDEAEEIKRIESKE